MGAETTLTLHVLYDSLCYGTARACYIIACEPATDRRARDGDARSPTKTAASKLLPHNESHNTTLDVPYTIHVDETAGTYLAARALRTQIGACMRASRGSVFLWQAGQLHRFRVPQSAQVSRRAHG